MMYQVETLLEAARLDDRLQLQRAEKKVDELYTEAEDMTIKAQNQMPKLIQQLEAIAAKAGRGYTLTMTEITDATKVNGESAGLPDYLHQRLMEKYTAAADKVRDLKGPSEFTGWLLAFTDTEVSDRSIASAGFGSMPVGRMVGALMVMREQEKGPAK